MHKITCCFSLSIKLDSIVVFIVDFICELCICRCVFTSQSLSDNIMQLQIASFHAHTLYSMYHVCICSSLLQRFYAPWPCEKRLTHMQRNRGGKATNTHLNSQKYYCHCAHLHFSSLAQIFKHGLYPSKLIFPMQLKIRRVLFFQDFWILFSILIFCLWPKEDNFLSLLFLKALYLRVFKPL